VVFEAQNKIGKLLSAEDSRGYFYSSWFLKINESLKLANFFKSSRPEIGDLLARIYGSCDSYSPDPEIAMSDKKELKDYAPILLITPKKSVRFLKLFKLQEE